MKKTVLLLLFAVLGLYSCEKKPLENKPENTLQEEPQNKDALENHQEPSPIYKEEDLISEAKKKPLTTLALSENHFDFNKIKQGEIVEHKYEITNTGKQPLIISMVKPGCGCTVPDYTKEPILPGEKGYVLLKFNSSNFEGMLNKSAAVYANVEQLPITLSFSANVTK